jgi:hypothetical protein
MPRRRLATPESPCRRTRRSLICRGEIEDLLEPELYRQALLTAFNVDVVASAWINTFARGKWSSRIALIFKSSGQAWDEHIETQAKTLVADSVVSNPKRALRAEAEPILEALWTSPVSVELG